MRSPRRVALLSLAAVVAATAAFTFSGSSGQQHLSAYFTRSTGLYVGDDVRVLGVRVGEVEHITPEGGGVRVDFTVDSGQKVPADAGAAIVAPSLVASRYLQVAPAYTGGPVMEDHSRIPLSRTAVPVEWDEVEKQLTDLADGLGPKGANKDGSLNKAISVVADNLGHGTAEQLNTTLSGLSKAADALASGRGDLFSTISNLQSFVANLNANDQAVRSFSAQLTTVSALLADNRTQLATAIDTLDSALGELKTFLSTNRGTIKASIAQLSTLSQNLADDREELAVVLHAGPTALSNVYNILDPRFGSFTGRLSPSNFQGLAQLVCGAVLSVDPNAATAESRCRSAIQPLVDLLGLAGGIPGTPGVALPGKSAPVSGGTAAKPAAPNVLGDVLSGTTGTVTSVLGLLLPGSGK